MKFYHVVRRIKDKLYVREVEDGKIKEKIGRYRIIPLELKSKNPANLNGLVGCGPFKILNKKGYIFFAKNALDDPRKSDFYIPPEVIYFFENYPGRIKYDIKKIPILIFDIEVISDAEFPSPDKAKFPIVSIACKLYGSRKTVIFGYGKAPADWKDDSTILKIFDSEEEMLKKFVDFVCDVRPAIITGWFISGFDIPYVANRLKNLGMLREYFKFFCASKALYQRIRNILDVESLKDFIGTNSLDYLKLFKKFSTQEYPSYSLEYISSQELSDHKIDYSEYVSLYELYQKNIEKFYMYNAKDVELVSRLEKKKKFIELAILMSYSAKANFDSTLGVIKRWEFRIYNHLLSKGVMLVSEDKKDDG